MLSDFCGCKVEITDNARGTVYQARIDCFIRDDNDGECDPVNPWYKYFFGKVGCGVLFFVVAVS